MYSKLKLYKVCLAPKSQTCCFICRVPAGFVQNIRFPWSWLVEKAGMDRWSRSYGAMGLCYGLYEWKLEALRGIGIPHAHAVWRCRLLARIAFDVDETRLVRSFLLQSTQIGPHALVHWQPGPVPGAPLWSPLFIFILIIDGAEVERLACVMNRYMMGQWPCKVCVGRWAGYLWTACVYFSFTLLMCIYIPWWTDVKQLPSGARGGMRFF